MKIIGIVCTNYNNAIGFKNINSLIFNIPLDMKLFRQKTIESFNGKMNTLIMGRNTWASLGRPFLPNRFNIVITSDYLNYQTIYTKHSENLIFLPNIPSCLNYLYNNEFKYNNIFVIGGSTIYKYFYDNNLYDFLYKSEIETPNDYGDIFFPKINFEFFDELYSEKYSNIDATNNLTGEKLLINYSFNIYSNRFAIKDKLTYLEYK
jgi:dihydrofolate reductase